MSCLGRLFPAVPDRGTRLSLRRTLQTPSRPCGVGCRVSSLCASLLPRLSEDWTWGGCLPCSPSTSVPQRVQNLLIWGVAWMAWGDAPRKMLLFIPCRGAGRWALLDIADPTQDVLFIWVPSCWEAAFHSRAHCPRWAVCPWRCSLLPRAMISSGSTDTPCCAWHGDSRDHVLPLMLRKFCTNPGA